MKKYYVFSVSPITGQQVEEELITTIPLKDLKKHLLGKILEKNFYFPLREIKKISL